MGILSQTRRLFGGKERLSLSALAMREADSFSDPPESLLQAVDRLAEGRARLEWYSLQLAATFSSVGVAAPSKAMRDQLNSAIFTATLQRLGLSPDTHPQADGQVKQAVKSYLTAEFAALSNPKEIGNMVASVLFENLSIAKEPFLLYETQVTYMSLRVANTKFYREVFSLVRQKKIEIVCDTTKRGSN